MCEDGFSFLSFLGRCSMKFVHLRYLVFGLTLCSIDLCIAGLSSAAIWNPTATGTYSWNADGNWVTPATFPNDTDAVADLSQRNVATGNQIINLNQSITVGQLLFGDTSGSQTYTINSDAGNLTNGAGSLKFDGGDAGSAGNSTLAGVSAGTGLNTINANIGVVDTLSAYSIGNNFQLNGALTGAGTINNTSPISDTTIKQFRIDGNLSGFTGTISVNRTATSDSFRFWGQTLGSADASKAKFELSGTTNSATANPLLIGRNTGTIFKMGELSGTGGRIEDDLSGTGGPTLTLEVGHLATSSSFSGVIFDKNTENSRTLHFTRWAAERSHWAEPMSITVRPPLVPVLSLPGSTAHSDLRHRPSCSEMLPPLRAYRKLQFPIRPIIMLHCLPIVLWV